MKILMTMAVVLLLINSVFANNYRVFYYVRGEHRERAYHYSVQANSKDEARRMLLRDEPKAIKIVINRMPD
jgi:hypothetical protein